MTQTTIAAAAMNPTFSAFDEAWFRIFSVQDWKDYYRETTADQGFFFYDTFDDCTDEHLQFLRAELLRDVADLHEANKTRNYAQSLAIAVLQLLEVKDEIARRKALAN